MFELTVSKNFTAKHALLDYRGADEKPHSHEWKCEVTISAGSLDMTGCVVDFVEVDEYFEKVMRPLKEKFLNEVPVFTELRASAENVAKYIFNGMSAWINSDRVRVTRARIFEDGDHSACYFE